MKVKIGNIIYDPNDQPIMLILSNKDKENIRDMLPLATKYCCYPDGMSIPDVEKFMGLESDKVLSHHNEIEPALPRIGDVPMKCPDCGWAGRFAECDADRDGDGSPGCPECESVVYPVKLGE